MTVGAQETPPSSRDVLTLKDSLDRAENNNPQLLVAKEELAITKAELKQSQALFYPSLNMGFNYIRYRNETLGITPPELGGVILEAPPTPSNGQRGNPSSDDLFLGRLGLVQTLYAGGRISSTYQLSKANVERAESAYDSLRFDVIYRTTKGFYSLVAAKEKEVLIKKMVDALTVLIERAPDFHSKVPLLRAKAELRRQMNDIHSFYKRTLLDFLQSMGVELFTDVDVVGRLDIPAPKIGLQEALVWAKQNRPELRETVLQERVDRLAVDLAMAERYPVVHLGGVYEVRNDESFFNTPNTNENNWNAALSLNIPLFDGFSSRAKIRRSRSQAEQGRYKRIQLEDQIEKEVRLAHEDYQRWSADVGLGQKELADINAAEPSSKKGGSLLDRLEFLQWELGTSLHLVEARYELSVAKADLERAVGRPLSD